MGLDNGFEAAPTTVAMGFDKLGAPRIAVAVFDGTVVPKFKQVQSVKNLAFQYDSTSIQFDVIKGKSITFATQVMPIAGR